MSGDQIRCRNCGRFWPANSRLCQPGGCGALLPGGEPARLAPDRTINVPRVKRGPGGGQIILLIGISLLLMLIGLVTRFDKLIPFGALVALIWGGIVFFRWLSSRRKNKQVKRVFESKPTNNGNQTFTVEVAGGATIFQLRPTEELKEEEQDQSNRSDSPWLMAGLITSLLALVAFAVELLFPKMVPLQFLWLHLLLLFVVSRTAYGFWKSRSLFGRPVWFGLLVLALFVWVTGFTALQVRKGKQWQTDQAAPQGSTLVSQPTLQADSSPSPSPLGVDSKASPQQKSR